MTALAQPRLLTTASEGWPGAGAGPDAPETPPPAWAPVCRVEDLLPERGVCALVGGRQVAVFLAHNGELFALSNYDPFSGAFVLSRGIMGTRGEAPVVSSPIGKQAFALATGDCLDQPGVRIPVIAVRAVDGVVEVADPDPAGAAARR